MKNECLRIYFYRGEALLIYKMEVNVVRYIILNKGLIFGILLLFVGASVIPSIIAADSQQNESTIETEDGLNTGTVTSAPYTGRLRIYVVEPVSRWKNYNGEAYHFGFLGFALNQDISIDPLDTYEKSITWNGDVTEENVIVIAVVSNSTKHQGYAQPPEDHPFQAYYTDATAATTPGNTGYNTVTTGFTHTVFVEEATATWCPYCPAMANTLYKIYNSGDYPWYFVAMIDDMNSQAASRLRSDYNIYGFPSAFFDGGYRVFVGGSSSESSYRPLIQASGKREVPPLNLSVSVTYIGDGDLQIGVNILNKDENINYPPATPPAPSGETSGNIGIDYPYTTSTTDANDYDVWYWFDWGDGTNSGWIGPRPSGSLAIATHNWTTEGNYNIKVKAKDSSGAESNWSDPLPITMPYSYKPIERFLELLFQRFLNAFLILQHLKGY